MVRVSVVCAAGTVSGVRRQASDVWKCLPACGFWRLAMVVACCALWLAVASPGFASTSLANEAIAADTTWDPAGSPYLLNGTVTINAGVTLTLQPGTIVKLGPAAAILCQGTLHAGGTAGQPIVFTSWKDDAYGGDSNGDGNLGPPVPGDWNMIRLYNDLQRVTGVFDHCLFRYGGSVAGYLGSVVTITNSEFFQSAATAVECYGTRMEVSRCQFRDNRGYGVKILHSISGVFSGDRVVELHDNVFTGTGSYPVYAVDRLARFIATGNTGSGNGINGMVIQATIVADNTFEPNPNFPYVFGGVRFASDQTEILEGATLTLAPGTVVKFMSAGYLEVRGALNAQGTATGKVCFTSLKDDSVGGDTDNAPGFAGPGDWRGIRIGRQMAGGPGAAATLFHAMVRYGGASSTANIHLLSSGSSLTAVACDITDAAYAGIVANGGNVRVNNCVLQANRPFAAMEMPGGPVVNARHNFWGHPSGPRDLSDDTATGGLFNPGGQGDPVTDLIDYSGFHTAPGYGQDGVLSTVDGAVGSDVEQVIAGQPFRITLTDPDADTSGGTRDTITVTVTSSSGDTLTAVLTETGNATGVFTAVVDTAWGTPVAGNAILEVVGGDMITIAYQDATNAAGMPQTVTRTLSVKRGNTGTLTATPPTATVGDTLHVTLVDRDLDQDFGGGNDQFNLSVSTSAGDTLTLHFQETTPGNFVADIPTAFGTTANTGDDTLQVKGGDTLTITYTDVLDTEGRSDLARTATITFRKGADGVVTTPATIRSDAGLAITVADDDMNKNPGVRESLAVQVQNSTTGDTETVTLQETDVDSGRFTATLPTLYATTAAVGDHRLQVKGGDAITTRYTDAIDALGRPSQIRSSVTTVQVGATGSFTAPPTQITAGEPIPLTVTDGDLNRTQGPRNDTLLFTVTSSGGDQVTVPLQEGNTPGVFTGTVPTAFAMAPVTGDETLQVKAGDTVTLTYADEINALGQTSQPTSYSVTVRGGGTGTFTITEPSILAGESLHLTVTDADLNLHANGNNDTLSLTLQTAGGDSLTVPLTESDTPGTFTLTLPTFFAAAPTLGDGQLQVHGGDTIRVTYTDVLDANGQPNVALARVIPVRAGTDGVLSVPETIRSNQGLTVKVTDGDRNVDAAVRDTLSVQIRNVTTGDAETLALQETGPDTGIFTGVLATLFATTPASGNSRLEVKGGDTFRVTYLDTLDAQGRQNLTRTDQGTVATGGSASFGSGGSSTIVAGEPIVITITDPDANTHAGGGNDTITVVITTSNGDRYTGTLHETGTAGVFTGTVPTEFSSTPNTGDNTIQVRGGDTVTITYTDAINGSGQTNQELTQTLTVQTGSTSTISVTETSVVAGSPIHLSLADGDLNAHAGAGNDTATVTITTSGGDQRTVTLQEGAAGTFSGTVETVYATTPNTGDDKIQVAGGQTVTIHYTDQINGSGQHGQESTQTLTVRTGTDGTVTAPTSIRSTDGVLVTVTDADLNTSSTTAETAQVTVRNSTSGDTEVLTLQETGPNTGIFRGTQTSIYGTTPASGDGKLQLKGNDQFQVRYIDTLTASGEPNVLRTSATGSVAVGSTATVGTGGSGTGGNGTGGNGTGGNGTGGSGGGPVIHAGDPVSIDIVDPEANVNPGAGNDTIMVTVQTSRGDTVTIPVHEDPNQPGVFHGEVPTEYNDVINHNDGTLQVIGGDTITIIYVDQINGNGETNVPVTIVITVEAGGTATLTFAQSQFTAGQPIQLRLADADLNVTPNGGNDTVTLTVTTSGGDSRTVTLQEEAAPGVFSVILQTAFGASPTLGDNTLQVKGGDVLSTSYVDALDAQGRLNQPRQASSTVRAGANGTLTGPTSFRSDEGLTLTIVDPDANTSATLNDTVQVEVRDTRTGETQTVSLTETGQNTGRFEGIVPTIYGTTVIASNNRLDVRGADTLVATYTDGLTASGQPDVARTHTATVATGNTGALTALPAQIRAGDPLPITIVDGDLNVTDGPGNDSVPITITASNGDSVTVTLREGPSAGSFTLNVGTVFAEKPTAGDGALQVAGGDTITVQYTDSLGGDGEVGKKSETTTAVLAGGSATLALGPELIVGGNTLTVTLNDPDLNVTDGAGNDTYNLLVRASNGDQVTVPLHEGSTPGSFSGTIPTVWATGKIDGDDKLQVKGDVTITAQYMDAVDAKGRTNQLQTATSTVRTGKNGKLTTATRLVADVALPLTVVDLDMNADPNVKESLHVRLQNTTNGDDESLALEETGPNTGKFTLTAETPYGESATSGDGKLQVKGSDHVVITYMDQLAAEGQPDQARVVNLTAAAGADGSLTGPATVNAGDTILLELFDPDLNVTNAIDTFDLELRTSSGDKLTAHLRETSTPGRFTVQVPTEFGDTPNASDAKLQVKGHDVISATYVDAVDTAGHGNVNRPYNGTVNGGATATFRFGDTIVFPGETTHLELADADLDVTPGPSNDSVTLNVQTSAGDRLTATLQETGTAGLFAVDLKTEASASINANDAVLQVQTGQQVTTSYVDALDDQGRVNQTRTATVNVAAGHDGGVGGSSSLEPGQPLTVTVTDPDANRRADTRETLSVTVTNSQTGEVEPLTLQETENSSGVFSGTLPTGYGKDGGVKNDGTLTVKPGATIRSVYHDSFGIAARDQDRVMETKVTGDGVSHQFAHGRQLIAVPAKLYAPNPNNALGINGSSRKLATYKTDMPDRGYHVFNPNQPDALVDALQPGMGYFALFGQSPSPLNLMEEFGKLLPQDQPYSLGLRKGWNLIGSPFTRDTAWSADAIRVRANGVEKTLRQAAIDGWVVDYAWGLENGNYQLVADPSAKLPGSKPWIQAFNGYWILASVDGELVLPPPAVGALSVTAQAAPVRANSLDGWAFTLGVQRGDLKDRVILGTAVASAAGVRIPKPPAFPGADQLTIGVIGEGAGQVTAMAYDLRGAAETRNVWRVQIQSSGTDQGSQMLWSDLNQVPKSVRLIMMDEQTGERRYMRTTTGFTIQGTGQPQQRTLQIIAEPATEGLRVIGLSATPNRGSVVVSYSMNQSAQVQVSVLGLNGKPIRSVASNGIGVQGMNNASWDGRDDQGRPVPAGFYLLQLTARTDIGEVAKHLVPVMVRP